MTEGWSGAAGCGPPIRLFAYTPEASLRLYAGVSSGSVLMTDGYEPYNHVAKTNKLVHLACWAHCRRYFFDAVQALPKDKRSPEQLAVRFMDLIAKLYEVESVARQEGLDANALTLRREEQSVDILKKIEALLLANLHAVAPKTLLGQALHYAAGQWPKLERFVHDGKHPIDNNACENSIRPFVIGRRGWLFGCSPTRSLVPTPRTCTRCFRPAKPTAPTATGT